MKKQTKTKVRAGICLNRNGAWRLDLNACLVTDSDRRVFLKANGWQPSYKSGLDVIHDEMGIYPINFLLRRIYPSAWVDYKTLHNMKEE